MALDQILKISQFSSTDFCCEAGGNLSLKLRDVVVCQNAPSIEVSHDGTAPLNIVLPVTGTQTINMDGTRLFINGLLQNTATLSGEGIVITQSNPQTVTITSAAGLSIASPGDPCVIQIFYQVCDTLGNLQNAITCS